MEIWYEKTIPRTSRPRLIKRTREESFFYYDNGIKEVRPRAVSRRIKLIKRR